MGNDIDFMTFMTKTFSAASIAAAVLAAIGYLIKSYFDKTLDRVNKTAEQLRNTSLAMQAEMRREERSELVAFRVAVEKWEDFLLTSVFSFAMRPAPKADVADLFKSDIELFLAVKVAIVRASTYLRDQQLEMDLMAAVQRIRQTYYPLINDRMPRLIELQSSLAPIQSKLDKFAEGGMKDMAFAPTPQDLEMSRSLEARVTEELRLFGEAVQGAYKPIAEQLIDVKQSINQYIYRPVAKAQEHAD